MSTSTTFQCVTQLRTYPMDPAFSKVRSSVRAQYREHARSQQHPGASPIMRSVGLLPRKRGPRKSCGSVHQHLAHTRVRHNPTRSVVLLNLPNRLIGTIAAPLYIASQKPIYRTSRRTEPRGRSRELARLTLSWTAI